MKFFASCLILAYLCAAVSAASAVWDNNGAIKKRSTENEQANFAEGNIAENDAIKTQLTDNESDSPEVPAIARSPLDEFKTLKEALTKAVAAFDHIFDATSNTTGAILKLLDYKLWMDVIKAAIKLPGKAVQSAKEASQETPQRSWEDQEDTPIRGRNM